MKKFAKMSLVAAVAVAGLTTTSSANSLEEAIKNGKTSGAVKVQYFQAGYDNAASDESSILAAGGNLNYTTGAYKGLVAGLTFQTSHVVDSDNDNANYYSGTMDASGSVLSQSYLAYTMGDTTVKAGRQYIHTKMINGSGSRMIKQSFEGYTAKNTSVQDTVISAVYIDKAQNRTDNAGSPGKFNKYEDGAFAIQGQNTTVNNLKITAEYLYVKQMNADNDKTIYVDAAYKFKPVTVAAQVYKGDAGDGVEDGTLYGFKITGKVKGISLLAAYSTQDEGDFNNGVGSNAEQVFTEAAFRGGVFTPNTDAIKVKASYDFDNGINLTLAHQKWEPDTSDDVTETDYIVGYKFNKAFKVQARYATFENYTMEYRSRLYLQYSF